MSLKVKVLSSNPGTAKKKKEFKIAYNPSWGKAQVFECLLSELKALSSNPHYHQKKFKIVMLHGGSIPVLGGRDRRIEV
jgi:hypothetical protein